MPKKIYVHPNNITICDDIDFDYLNQYNWQVQRHNLRLATMSENCFNRKTRCDNRYGITGIGYYPRIDTRKHWCARITINYRTINLGSFYTRDEAIQARLRAEKRYFPETFRLQEELRTSSNKGSD